MLLNKIIQMSLVLTFCSFTIPGTYPAYNITLSYHVSLPSSWLSQFLTVVGYLVEWSTIHHDLSDVFLMVRLGYGFEGGSSKFPISSHFIEGIHFPHKLSLLRLTLSPGWGSNFQPGDKVNLKFVNFPHCKVTLFLSLFILCYLEGNHYEQSTLRTADLCSVLFIGECLHILLGVPWHGIFMYSPPFV